MVDCERKAWQSNGVQPERGYAMEKGTDSVVDAVLAWLSGLKAGEGGARGGMAVFPLKHGANGSADGAFAYRHRRRPRQHWRH